FEPGGKALATGRRDGRIQVWDVETGKCDKELGSHGSKIKILSWRADGKRLVSWSEDGRMRVWDIETGKCCLELDKGQENIGKISFMADGRIALTG
ncbi:hypothetical protein GUITHDRAFT_60282, partial [Guillardia theta CCMP2712]